ncbi:hypothetical protein Salmuc_01707 [Salipiger mucosus DSM 16094]|uniref:FCP1 homology domain-containing protein n=2 Tax=Salipiger mucosus TaxID=263378 RepID=S9QWF5_9RHOB|nr:hypothetical protein Salmuc_01707 [Salipiger mucosus DSM 16094]
MENAAIQDMIAEFNERSSDFGFLEPIEGAQEAVRQFVDDGHELIVVTSCSEDPVCIARREQNLLDVFDDVFEEIHCLSRGISKLDTLSRFPASIWVEDNYKNALAGLEAGHKPMLLEYPHNADFKAESPDEITWSEGWKDLLPKMQETLRDEPRLTVH